MADLPIRNRDLVELLARAAEHADTDVRGRALRRASRAALMWGEEAAAVHADGRSVSELFGVGPFVAQVLEHFIQDPPPRLPEPPPTRAGFWTMAEARAVLAAEPAWRKRLRGDLQAHSVYSDGKNTVAEMAAEAESLGYSYIAQTDHSKSLRIAKGMDEARLAAQGREIDALNERLAADGSRLRVLKAIEMDLTPEGEGDMDHAALASLDLVLGAFHSKLRLDFDQTSRYLRALRNPTIDVLAHPRARMFDRRSGLQADWPRVLDAARTAGIAMEIDCTPYRQDLELSILEQAREAEVMISIGSDAHNLAELHAMDLGIGAALHAGIAPERILNFKERDELAAWVAERRGG